jgi:uncharacterized phiE125 gp8 family phage protein
MGYRVIIPPTAEPITLEEAKRHLRVVFADEDAEIAGFITAARMMLEQRINRVLMPQTIETSVYPHGLFFPVLPARSVVNISYVDNAGATVPLDSAFYVTDFYQEPPLLLPAYGISWPAAQAGSPLRIRYEAGYASAEDVPAPLKHWILLAIGTMYEHRATVEAGASIAELPEDFMTWLWQPYMVYV